MPGAHRNDDVRFCGAKTIVVGQSNVRVNGRLWAVENDYDTHCNQGALNAIYGAKNVRIGGLLVICAVGDSAAPDKEGCVIRHPSGATNPLGHSYDVIVYGGAAGGGK
jgi:uncharacterized Zn-binding protein involved in type VI secretion